MAMNRLEAARNPETSIEVKRFTEKQKEILKKEGYVVYALTGQSIRTLKKDGRKFQSERPQLETLISKHSEVAINPSMFLLPINEKNRDRYGRYKEDAYYNDFCQFSDELEKKVKGVEVIIGGALDYAELAFLHLDATGEYLFDRKEYLHYGIRTSNWVEDSLKDYCTANVNMGGHTTRGLDISLYDTYSLSGDNKCGPYMNFSAIAPLVVPI